MSMDTVVAGSSLLWAGALNNPIPVSVACCGSGVVLGREADKLKVLYMTCKSWRCPVCAPRKAARWRGVIADGKPERFITLTCDPAYHPDPVAAVMDLSKAFSKLVAMLRKLGYSMEYVRIFELCKSGWPHIHLVQRGDYIPHTLLAELWMRYASSHVVHIRRVESDVMAANYIAKYMGKDFAVLAAAHPRRRMVSKSRGWVLPVDDVVDTPTCTWTVMPHGDLKSMLGVFACAGSEIVESDREIGAYTITLPCARTVLRLDRELYSACGSILDTPGLIPTGMSSDYDGNL